MARAEELKQHLKRRSSTKIEMEPRKLLREWSVVANSENNNQLILTYITMCECVNEKCANEKCVIEECVNEECD